MRSNTFYLKMVEASSWAAASIRKVGSLFEVNRWNPAVGYHGDPVRMHAGTIRVETPKAAWKLAYRIIRASR